MRLRQTLLTSFFLCVLCVLCGSFFFLIGLLLLIATPIARVIFSLFAFVRQRDLTYIIVTSIVLIELIYSLVGEKS
ncbi:DUF1634 domain-containing protein [Nostoc sp.]|uniref:DUF1634 domain-containing protein n=1 Tax=Nostoc sp. TaxID=1180 RepID=UPI003FA5D608